MSRRGASLTGATAVEVSPTDGGAGSPNPLVGRWEAIDPANGLVQLTIAEVGDVQLTLERLPDCSPPGSPRSEGPASSGRGGIAIGWLPIGVDENVLFEIGWSHQSPR